MLLQFAIGLFLVILVIDIIHYGALVLFLKMIRRNEWTKPETDFMPKTAMLLTLCGADPFLSAYSYYRVSFDFMTDR